MRTLALGSLLLSFASAGLLYAVNTDTRQLTLQVAAQAKQRDTLKSDIAVLRAEAAYLSRPERIAPLARQYGLVPLMGDQIVDPFSFSGATLAPVAPPNRSTP